MFSEENRRITLSREWEAEFIFLYEVGMGINEWGLVLHGRGGRTFHYFKDKGILPCSDPKKQADDELKSRLSLSECARYIKVKRGTAGDWVVDLERFRLAPIRICMIHRFIEGGVLPIWEHPIKDRLIHRIAFKDGETAVVAFPFLNPETVDKELIDYERMRWEQIEQLRGVEKYAAAWEEDSTDQPSETLVEPLDAEPDKEAEQFAPGQRRLGCGCVLLAFVLISVWTVLFIWGLFH